MCVVCEFVDMIRVNLQLQFFYLIQSPQLKSVVVDERMQNETHHGQDIRSKKTPDRAHEMDRPPVSYSAKVGCVSEVSNERLQAGVELYVNERCPFEAHKA